MPKFGTGFSAPLGEAARPIQHAPHALQASSLRVRHPIRTTRAAVRQSLLLASSAARLRRRLLARYGHAVRRIWRDRERSVRCPTAQRGAPAAGAAPAPREGRTAASRRPSSPWYRLVCSLPVSEHGTSALRAAFCTSDQPRHNMKGAFSLALAAEAVAVSNGKYLGRRRYGDETLSFIKAARCRMVRNGAQ